MSSKTLIQRSFQHLSFIQLSALVDQKSDLL